MWRNVNVNLKLEGSTRFYLSMYLNLSSIWSWRLKGRNQSSVLIFKSHVLQYMDYLRRMLWLRWQQRQGQKKIMMAIIFICSECDVLMRKGWKVNSLKSNSLQCFSTSFLIIHIIYISNKYLEPSWHKKDPLFFVAWPTQCSFNYPKNPYTITSISSPRSSFMTPRSGTPLRENTFLSSRVMRIS